MMRYPEILIASAARADLPRRLAAVTGWDSHFFMPGREEPPRNWPLSCCSQYRPQHPQPQPMLGSNKLHQERIQPQFAASSCHDVWAQCCSAPSNIPLLLYTAPAAVISQLLRSCLDLPAASPSAGPSCRVRSVSNLLRSAAAAAAAAPRAAAAGPLP
jgi:hypothetical protein